MQKVPGKTATTKTESCGGGSSAWWALGNEAGCLGSVVEEFAIEDLKRMLIEARKQRKLTENKKFRLTENLQEKLKTSKESIEEFSKKTNAIKDSMNAEIMKERQTKLLMEEKLKETRNTLNAICSNIMIGQRPYEISATSTSSSYDNNTS